LIVEQEEVAERMIVEQEEVAERING